MQEGEKKKKEGTVMGLVEAAILGRSRQASQEAEETCGH